MVNVTKVYTLLQFLLIILTHIIAFYIGRYFCFDGTDCGFSAGTAATEESGAAEQTGFG